MVKRIQSIRGMKDYLPKEMVFLQYLENLLKQVLVSYGYSEIRLPIVEQTLLFKRAIGEITDVVEKEMYSFEDLNGDHLTLRPEGTAGCVRAGIEHSLFHQKLEQRWWYIGPMFRHERPQKGRYRQFYQLGAEVFGQHGPDIDAELIMLTARWWKVLGISEYVTLELNSIGSVDTRNRYCKALVTFLVQHERYLNNIYRRSIYTNPMRILDTKNIQIQELLNDAPVIAEYLDDNAHKHFSSICKLLDLTGINYKINTRLVRGLDYYNYTVFEWTTKHLGSQGTICAGGRYDLLVEQLGGKATPAIGAAIGLDRLVLLVQRLKPSLSLITLPIDIYIVAVGDATQSRAMLLAEKIHDAIPSLRIVTNYGGGNFKKQFSRANKYSASLTLIIGENEIVTQQVTIKDLSTGKQKTLAQNEIIAYLYSFFFKKKD